MLTWIRFASVALAIVAAPFSSVIAQDPDVPMLLNYQGQLKDSSGNPENGTFSMTFKFFDAATGGNQLPTPSPWTETQSVSVSDGDFNVLLGAVADLPAVLFDGGPTDSVGPLRFLEVAVDGEVLAPRRRVGSSAYAISRSTSSFNGWANEQIFESSGTFDASGIDTVFVEVVAAGGGGGAVTNGPIISGQSGGASSFGAFLSATGGSGGTGVSKIHNGPFDFDEVTPGGVGGSGSGGTTLVAGGRGGHGWGITNSVGMHGFGGASALGVATTGRGATKYGSANGVAGSSYGAGGEGAPVCGGGGGGGYAAGVVDVSGATNVVVTVGVGGNGGNGTIKDGGRGADGAVIVRW